MEDNEDPPYLEENDFLYHLLQELQSPQNAVLRDKFARALLKDEKIPPAIEGRLYLLAQQIGVRRMTSSILPLQHTLS